MIPLVVAVAIGSTRVAGVRPWIPIPLFLVWLFLLPFCIVLLPVYFIGCRHAGLLDSALWTRFVLNSESWRAFPAL